MPLISILYLRIATELNLKRLIVGGLERVYEIGRIFRNEGMDIKHNPEFTSIELYEAYGDYQTMMDITEKTRVRNGAARLGHHENHLSGKEIDLTPPWPRMTMVEAVKKFSGADFEKTLPTSKSPAKWRMNITSNTVSMMVSARSSMLSLKPFVEENLIQPTIITGHPFGNLAAY